MYRDHPLTITPDDELSYAISNTKKKLPVIIDTNTTWSDIILTSNALEYVYLIEDSGFDIYKLDLSAYRKHILKGLSTQKSDLQREMELCAETDRNMVYRLISKWDESKYVEITIENFKLKEIIEE